MYSTILFDLDGTLTEPYIGITNGIMYALEKMGRDIPPRESLKHFIGPPLISEFQRSFDMSEEQAKTAAAFYREYYFDKGLYENSVIDGAEELLRKIQASGRRICLATSKPEHAARLILEHFGLLSYFDFVGAATLDGRICTKEQVLRHVLENTGASPEECLLVGDRMYDILGAHEVGMKCAAVLVGYGSREEVAQYGADYVAEALTDVMEFI